MMRRLVREENGMTMGLAVIMVVLIGVMGAGLLTFVQRDLQAVIEVNQGQRALDMTEAGIQAGKMQLGIDSNGERYNGNGGDLDGDGADTADTSWSYKMLDGTNGLGKTLNLGGNLVNVKIQYLTPTPSSTPSLASNPNYAPEVLPAGQTRYPDRKDYFKITAQGTVGNANRKVEAIYRTKSIGFPAAYFATSNVTFNGNAFSIDNVSVFSQASIINLRAGRIGGCDIAYGNWNSAPWNTTSRGATSGTQTIVGDPGGGGAGTCVGHPTGVASEGTINYQSGETGRPGVIDYDNYDGASDGTDARPDFVPNTWTAAESTQDADDISYPFNPDESTHVDLEAIRAAAQSGQNGSVFVRRPPGDNFDITSATVDYPANSNSSTVYYLEFANVDGTFTTTPGGSLGVAKGDAEFNSAVANPKGTIVIVNGDFKGSPSQKTFTGSVILRDPVDTDTTNMVYDNSGNFDLQGFVNIEGSITISGSANSNVPASVINARIPGTYGMKRWSWRECYNTTCS